MVRPLLILAGALALAACQVRQPDACAVRCTAAAGCPDDMTCGADSFCYGADQPVGSCTGTVPDAGPDDDDGDPPADGGDDPVTCDQQDPCDAVSQCGCEGDEGCYLSGTGEASCLTAGDRVQDQSCGGDDDCAAGYDCISAGAGGRHCKRYCADDGDCGGELSLCNREVGGGAARICTSDCDPLIGGCRSGEDCVLGLGEDERYDANCRVPGAGNYLDTCVDQSDCGPGLLCVTTPDVGTYCQYLCEVGSTDCGSSGTCGRLDPHAYFAGTEYGVCSF